MPYAEKQAFIMRRDLQTAARLRSCPSSSEKIMKRESPDETSTAGDILYIPDNKKRRTTMSVIDRMTSFGAYHRLGSV